MKNNALKLVSLALVLPLMAGCGGKNKKEEGTIWSAEIDAEMIKYVGEVLPFVDLDKETLQYGYDESYSMFYLYDDNETNLVEGYETKLEAAGFEYTEEDFYGITYSSYDKDNDIGHISVTFGWVEAQDDEPAGNYINVTIPEFIDEDTLIASGYEKQQGWPTQLVADTMEGSDFTVPSVNPNGEWFVASELAHDDDYGDWYCAYLVTKNDYLDAFSLALENAGAAYDDEYGCFYDTTNTSDWEIYVSNIRQYTVINIYGPTLSSGGGDVTNETVNDDGSIDVGFTFSSTLVDGTAYTNETIESTSASLTISKGNNDNNAPTYYSNGDTLRCYYKNQLVINAASGLTINSVTIEVGSVKNQTANNITASSGTITSTGTTAPATVTISGVNASTLTINIAPEATKGNIGISSITVNVSSAQ